MDETLGKLIDVAFHSPHVWIKEVGNHTTNYKICHSILLKYILLHIKRIQRQSLPNVVFSFRADHLDCTFEGSAADM